MAFEPDKYRRNHYVPIWYQKRLMLPGQKRYFRLDLKPDVIRKLNNKTGREITYVRRDLHEWSPDLIFVEDDLYTLKFGALIDTGIERFFFGDLDNSAGRAFDYFTNFQHPSVNAEAFKTFLRFMSVQKLRTPKGLAAMASWLRPGDRNRNLIHLQQLQDVFCAIWTECVWSIASAEASPVKFIVSDHPVTVYNRACPPLSLFCSGANDPDIRCHASHTYLPLSIDKVLILTNLSWARDPYQNETRLRPNPDLFRDAMFNFTNIQTDRVLTEDEVLQINLITKRRAYRYIAAADREWLFPELHVSTDHWKKLGGGYLLMPEPRLLNLGGQIAVGYKDGRSDVFSEYGHRPWQEGYEDRVREDREAAALYRFQAEWAAIHGPNYKARSFNFHDKSWRVDDDETTEWRKQTLSKYGRFRR